VKGTTEKGELVMSDGNDFEKGLLEFELSRRLLLGLGGALGVVAAPGTARAHDDDDGHGPNRMLVRGATVLSMEPAIGDLDSGDVLVENGKIAAVGTHLHAGNAQVVDATGMIVMPGFIDTHRHMWQGLLRNIGPDDLLGDYLTKILYGFAPIITPEEVYWGDTISALSAVNAGVTTILDWSHIATSSEHTDAAIHALRNVGVRAVYGYGPNFGLATPWYENLNNPYPGDIVRLRKQYFSSDDQLMTLALAAAGPEFSNVDAAVIEWGAARGVGAPISVHVGVGGLGNQGLLQELSTRVAFGSDTTYIHTCTLSDAEWQLIAESGGSVSLAIPIEMQMGHGLPPIQKVLDLGIRPSLSVDVETNQPTDMFTQMRACFALQRGLLNKDHLFPDTSHVSELLTARQVLEFATIEGARTNHLDHKTGSLTPGKQADFILLQTRALNVAPLNNPTAAVVLGMDTSNVDSVFVAGRALKWKGSLVGVNVDRLLAQLGSAHEALMARAGV
jgi:cytosine/adenosine deaminase-related metal-dependent hydrolase